jgi:nitrogen fixation protein FixH
MKVLLGIAALIGLGAVVAAIVVGTSTFEGIVVRDPYGAGLQWDAQQRARTASGWSVLLPSRSFPHGTSALSAMLSDRDGVPLRDAVVAVRISYPSTSRYDKEYSLAADGQGRYTGVIDLPRRGLWNVQFIVSAGGKQAVLEDSIRAD